MTTFLIQSDENSVPLHDFSYTLIESVNYHEWLLGENIMKYMTYHGGFQEDRDTDNYVPIGSVEFVSDYLYVFHRSRPKPMNIPAELMKFEFTRRAVINGTEKDITEKLFVKSNDTIKGLTELTDSAPVGNYQISEIVDFKTEWRAFVYKQKLVGLQNYAGDFTCFPNVDVIHKMIDECINLPIAYTLDVGVIEDDHTVIIEAHDFFSVGLYGFSDHRILPYMYMNWFNQYLENI
jgi:hypothetical protein